MDWTEKKFVMCNADMSANVKFLNYINQPFPKINYYETQKEKKVDNPPTWRQKTIEWNR